MTTNTTKLNFRISFFPYLKTGLGFTQEFIPPTKNFWETW